MSPLTLTVIAANIRGLPRQRYIFVRARIRRAMNMGGIESIVCLSECAPSNITKSPFKRNRVSHSRIVLAEAKRAGKSVYGSDTEIPIALSTAVWHVDYHDIVDVHGGKKKVTPPRKINRLGATHRKRKVPVEVNGVHPINKGHYPAWKRGISWLAFRIARLSDYSLAVARNATKAHKAGRMFVAAGDWNDPSPSSIHKAQVHVHSAGLDHTIAVPAPGRRIVNVVRGRVGKTKQMDHPIIATRMTQTGD